MKKTHLNVKYGDIIARIRMKDVEDISDLQDKIKGKYGNDLDAPAARIKLFREKENGGEQITKWAQIQALEGKYFQENSGSYLEIGPAVDIVEEATKWIRTVEHATKQIPIDRNMDMSSKPVDVYGTDGPDSMIFEISGY